MTTQGTYGSHEKVNILIVDDRVENLIALEALLGSLDVNMVRATSGPEALKQLLSTEFAMILMDVIMPGMDGFETAEIIRQREKTQFIPIIFLTALASDQQYAFKGYASGAVDYMYKPLVGEILRAKVKVFIDLYEKNKMLDQQREELERINMQLSGEIAERKRIEELERMALVASKSFNAMTINDWEGKMEWVNEGFTMLTGYTPEELIGTKGEAVRKDPTKYSQLVAEVKQKKVPLTYEEKHYTKEGKEYWVLVTLTPVLNDSGGLDKILTIESDITSQKLTEEKLIEATKKAEEAVKAKQQFLANMSHEIRTPMNAIIGFTKVILKTNLTEKQREYLDAIKLSGDTMIVLINDILDLAKVDAGKMTFEQIPFRLSVSVAAMLHLFEAKIREKNLELVKVYDSKIPDVLMGDPVRLHQIIINLLSNATKFTSAGKITLSVQVLKEDTEQVELEFAVTDSGIGIPEDRLDTIFDYFEQASTGTSRIYGGTGLGLAIVKKLVEGQHGEIKVKSKPGEGSTFSFTLTFKKTNAAVETDDEPDTGFESAESGNVRILVVEDIPLNQLLMKTLLDEFGFAQDIAENGRIAVENLQHNSYDLVLMDLQMPEMDGFEATEYIRTKLKMDIPIIALTADVTAADVQRCKDIGMNDYIAKPVDDKMLYAKITRLVKKAGDQEIPQKQVANDQKTNHSGRYVDFASLKEQTKGNDKLMRQMITLYLQQTPPLLTSIREGIDNKDWEAVYKGIHKMIPSFWMMGIKGDYGSMAKTLQEYASKKEHLEEIPELFTKIEHASLEACKEFEELMNHAPNEK